MDRLFRRPLIAVSALILICGYLFFLQLGSLALTDPDETFYAETAKEMLTRGEWVTPYLYGKPQFEKPILFYWLVEASFKVFGVNEFAARFPSAVLGTVGVIAMFFLGGILFGRRAGFLSAIILAVNVEYIVLSRACVTDMALFAFMLLAALFFFYGYIKEKGYFYLLSSASLALATLTKGPVYFVLFAAAILAFLFFTKDLKALKKMPLAQAALVFIAVSMPWYIAIYRLHGKAFIEGFFGLHNVTRFLVSEHKIGSQVYYNIPIILGGLFPWSVFLPAGFWHICTKISQKKSGPAVFLMAWFFVIFGFFTVSSTKLPTYIFPSFVSLAVIVGVLLDDFLNGKVLGLIARTTRISYYILAAIMLLGWVGAGIYAKLDFPSIMAGVIVSGLAIAFGGLSSLAAFINKRYALSFALVAFSVAIFLCPLSAMVLPEVERYESSKETAAKLLTLMKPGEELGAESNYVPGLAFYTGKFPVDLDKHHIQIGFMNSDKRIWAVIKEKNHKHLYNGEITKEYVKPSYVVFSVGKRSIVTNEMPSDGRFLVKRERTQ